MLSFHQHSQRRLMRVTCPLLLRNNNNRRSICHKIFALIVEKIQSNIWKRYIYWLDQMLPWRPEWPQILWTIIWLSWQKQVRGKKVGASKQFRFQPVIPQVPIQCGRCSDVTASIGAGVKCRSKFIHQPYLFKEEVCRALTKLLPTYSVTTGSAINLHRTRV